MKTRHCLLAAALYCMLLSEAAFAYYNPQTGRFLSRDPVGELGFQVVQRASMGTLRTFDRGDNAVAFGVSAKPSERIGAPVYRRFDRQAEIPSPLMIREDWHVYAFVSQDPVSRMDYLGLGSEWYRRGRCCNSSGGDEWALVAEGEGCAKWRKLAPGECIGGYWGSLDCEGMTCGGGFYYVGWEHEGICRTPGCDKWPYTNRRWTPSDRNSGARSPRERGACPDEGNTPPGYGYGPRDKCCKDYQR